MAAIITDLSMINASAFFGKLATTNYYQVYIGSGWVGKKFLTDLETADWGPRVSWSEYGETIGLLCTDASIPASTYATAEVKDNYMGVPQEFAHTRLYTDIDFTFYVDRDYKILGFFEFWMNYIGGAAEVSSASPNNTRGNVYRRFNYPETYKNSQIYITKFERDYKSVGRPQIQYQLINAFPKSVMSIPISYGSTELMKVTVTMNYDRYVVDRNFSLPRATPPTPAAAAAEGRTADNQQQAIPQAPNRPRTRSEVLTGGFIR